MVKPTVGKRVQAEVRSVWPKENEFSDWLITPDGLELLANDLELQIENPIREAKAANFPCDIVGNLVGDEKHIVAIENQFGRTNHDHLAKLITYAATHHAMTGIWIAEEVADDHRQVIDWLNENTSNSIAFYLAELKLYSINGSPAAPQLDIVCRPNTMMKQENSRLSDAEKKRNDWRFKFWQEIHDDMKTIKLPFKLQSASTSHWSSIAIGRSNFSISMLLIPKNQTIGIDVGIQPEWKQFAFEQLETQKATIHKELGRELEWRLMPEKASSLISLRESLDPGRAENRRAVCEWFKEWTPKVFNAFQKRIKELKEPEGER